MDSFSKIGDAKSAVCSEASKSLSHALDEVLEPLATQAPDVVAPQTPASAGNDSNLGIPLPTKTEPWAQGPDNLDLLSPSAFVDLDFSTWMNSMDWMGTVSDWTHF